MLTYSVVRHHTTAKSFTQIIFTLPPQRVLRCSFLGTSCQSRDRVPPFYGILINTDVGNPIVPVSMFSRLKASPNRLWGGLLVFDLL